jgi:predicted O-methyltransferase YrrM
MMVNPIKFQLSSNPDDPFSLKALPKLSPKRLVWTTQSRMLELISKLMHEPMGRVLNTALLQYYDDDRGGVLTDTAVTSKQVDFLCRAAEATENIDGDIFEIGSYRGVSTRRMAECSEKIVYAVDPFIGYGGAEDDFEIFRKRTSNLSNVHHLRKTSGEAFQEMAEVNASLVFIDAIHDVSNSWFDVLSWSKIVLPGGMLAMHDVDDHSGSGLTARRFVKRNRNFVPWAYCPNLLIVQRTS